MAGAAGRNRGRSSLAPPEIVRHARANQVNVMRQKDVQLDFITALPVEDCVRTLKSRARQTPNQRLKVRTNGMQLLIESAGGGRRSGPVNRMWFLRFEGSLTTTSTGTRVVGTIVYKAFNLCLAHPHASCCSPGYTRSCRLP